MNFSGIKKIMELYFNLTDATAIYRDANRR